LRVLLDTAVLIMAIEDPARLSRRARLVIENPETVREVSSISIAEIAVKAAIGKLILDPAQVVQGINDLRARILPYSPDHAWRLFQLPLHHRDPFDRQLIAQAQYENIPVITPDSTFRDYAGLKVIW
jgi:PIN domain nuclease of toxin-antitoxin system